MTPPVADTVPGALPTVPVQSSLDDFQPLRRAERILLRACTHGDIAKVGLRRPVAPAAIVGFSGMFIMPNDGPPESVKDEIVSRPPILLIHGDRDDLIPVQALFHASSALSALDVPVEWHISAGVGHGIDQEGLRQGGEFLARRFGL